MDVSAAQLGTPASSPDAKMAEELNRVIGLADAAAGGPQQQLGDALKVRTMRDGGETAPLCIIGVLRSYASGLFFRLLIVLRTPH